MNNGSYLKILPITVLPLVPKDSCPFPTFAPFLGAIFPGISSCYKICLKLKKKKKKKKSHHLSLNFMMLSAPSPKLHYKALFKKDANKAQGCHLLSEALEV